MSNTPARLLRLLSLLQIRRDWSGTELAAHLEVTTRTVRRDVERLRQLGYPVDTSMGPMGGYQLAAGTSLPPLLLDGDEAVAVTVRCGFRTSWRAGMAESGRDGRAADSPFTLQTAGYGSSAIHSRPAAT